MATKSIKFNLFEGRKKSKQKMLTVEVNRLMTITKL